MTMPMTPKPTSPPHLPRALLIALGFGLMFGLALAPAALRADTVLLDDGTLVSGTITATTEKSLRVHPASGPDVDLDRKRVIYAAFQDWAEIRAQGIKADTYYSFPARCRLDLPSRAWNVEFDTPKLGIEGTLLELTQASKGLYSVLAAEKWTGTLDDYMRMLLALYQKNLGATYKVLATRDLTIDMLPARMVTFQGKSGMTPIVYKATVVLGPGRAYRVLAWTTSGNFRANEKELESIADGLKILRGPTPDMPGSPTTTK